MPNLCNNSITIQGPTETVKTLWDEANQEGSGLLEAMKPIGKWEYGTAVEAWGTKWDVDTEGLEFTDNGDGTAAITGWFDSAWAPPIDAYNSFLDDNDNCSLDATYEEGGMDFAGIYDNGDDQYLEGISEVCERIVRGTETLEEQDELFQKLDEEFELVESRREYIEEQMAEEKALEEAKETA